MKLNKTLLSVALLSSALLTGCDYNDEHFDGLDDMTKITDVKNVDLTLTAEDYTSITSLGKSYASENGQSDALAALKTTMAFTSELKAEDYVPFYLADKYTTADNGSVARVTYNVTGDTNPLVLAINQSTEYKVSADDYATVWTDGSGYEFFTPSKPAADAIPAILAAAKADAVEGEYVMVTYDVAAEDPAVETGDTGNTGGDTGNTGGDTGGDTGNTGGDTGGDTGNTGGDTGVTYDSVTTAIAGADADGTNSFTCNGTVLAVNANAFMLQDATGNILVYTGSAPTVAPGDVATVAGPVKDYFGIIEFTGTDAAQVTVEKTGTASFSLPTPEVLDGAGSDAYVAAVTTKFVQYTGTLSKSGDYFNIAINGASTAVGSIRKPTADIIAAATALDGKAVTVTGYAIGTNSGKVYLYTMVTSIVEASSASVMNNQTMTRVSVDTDTAHAIYMYNGTEWVAVDAVCPTKADFAKMGNKYGNFSNSMLPQNYLPAYLGITLPYAQEGDKQVCAYPYYGGDNAILSTEYVYTEGAWKLEDNTTVETKQFQLVSGDWVYNPSLTITLPGVKKDPLTVSYFQPMVDWVWENVDVPAGAAEKGDGFVSSYGNNEYYTGVSAYYGNADWRAAKAKEQKADAFDGMSDEEIVSFMQNNFKTVLGGALPTIVPELKYIEGVEVSITINFVVYTGSNENWTIKYLIQSDGSFKYVEDSLHIVE